jgi:hypothetical protein
MGTNCVLLADLFLYSYEADFIQGLARSFDFTFRYVDDVLSLNNSRLGDFVDCIYPIELEIKDITDTDRSVSYLDLHLEKNTVCTHRYADCLLKNTPTKHSKYVVNQKLEHVEDIGFRELFGRIRVVFYKIRSVSS